MMRKALAAVAVAFGGMLNAVADYTPTYTVPAGVDNAIEELKSASTSLADKALPAVVAIGLAFIAFAIITLLFRWFKRFAAGR